MKSTTIKLTIAGKPQEMTIEQARALYAELTRMFGSSMPIVIERDRPVRFPIYPPPFTQPWQIPFYGDTPFPHQPTITCCSKP